VAAVAGALQAGGDHGWDPGRAGLSDPSPVGAVLAVEAVLERVDGRRLEFAVRLRNGDRPVASGLITRMVVDTAAFLRDAAAEVWRGSFRRAPYLREQLVLLGVLVETFETAVTWDRLDELVDRVRPGWWSLGKFVPFHCSLCPPISVGCALIIHEPWDSLACLGIRFCRTALDHPFDHPDDPSVSVGSRLDRRGIQREQARSSGADQAGAEHPTRNGKIVGSNPTSASASPESQRQ
jgi:FAD linked oxidases, C-terminal domain